VDHKESLEFHLSLKHIIDEEIKSALKNQQRETFCSPETNLLGEAMAKAQGAYLPLKKTCRNELTGELYSDIESMFLSVRDALSKNNIFFTQVITSQDDKMIIVTRIESQGQYMQSTCRFIPILDDLKATNSTVVFLKKQAAMALLGIANKDDDDASSAEQGRIMREDKGLDSTLLHPEKKTYATFNDTQCRELLYELDGFPDILRNIFKSYQVTSVADLPKIAYRTIIDKSRSLKKLRNEP
jgi:hypothetical protein